MPTRYRAPIVLCYLEGMTHDQAAVELGWPVGTVRGRLARARDILRSRLTRRGLGLSAGLAATVAPADAASAALSTALIQATVRAAVGRRAAVGLSGTTAGLLKDVLRDMARAGSARRSAPLVLIAFVAGTAGTFRFPGPTRVSVERATITKPRPVPRPVPIDPAGDPLPDGALARLGTTRFLHGTHVSHVTRSPDGTTLASSDGTLYLWDPLTGRERHHIETGMVQAFAYAPDGQSLAVQVLDMRDPFVPGKLGVLSLRQSSMTQDPAEKSVGSIGSGRRAASHFPPTARCWQGASRADQTSASHSGTPLLGGCFARSMLLLPE